MIVFNIHKPKAHGPSLGTAVLKQSPEDFQVEEVLPETLLPSNETEGEHLYIHATKTNMNTPWLAKQLAKIAGCSEKDVGYCGLKDRHAVTSQWFSLYLPKREKNFRVELPLELSEQVVIHQQQWFAKKLRRGMHTENRFKLCLREVDMAASLLEARLHQIRKQGVPNYFGEQRFGRDGNNLHMANQLWVEQKRIAARSQKQMAISAARSYVFNEVLAARVEKQLWHSPIEGDVNDHDGLPTGPMWGRGRSQASAAAAEIETDTLVPLEAWLQGLEHCGLQQERRSLVMPVKEMAYQYLDREKSLTLEFALAPGQYATSVLAELFTLQQPSRPVL